MCLKWKLKGKDIILKQVKRPEQHCSEYTCISGSWNHAECAKLKDNSCMTASVPQDGWAAFIQQTLLLSRRRERTTKPRFYVRNPNPTMQEGSELFSAQWNPNPPANVWTVLFFHMNNSQSIMSIFFEINYFTKRILCKRQFFLQNPCKNNSPSITNPNFKRPFTITKINQSPFPLAKQRTPLQNTGEPVTSPQYPGLFSIDLFFPWKLLRH